MLKFHKPTSPAKRNLVTIDKQELWKGRPIKKLSKGIKNQAGRNNQGRITTRHKGGGNKKTYRTIDFKRDRIGKAKVIRIEYDPNRTAFIALIEYQDNDMAYIIAPQKLNPGEYVEAGEKVDIKIGNAMDIANIPVGTIIHNIELKPKKGAQLARSAGNYARIAGRDAGYVILKMPSGEQRIVPELCRATVGAISNPDNMNVKIAKAGRNRWKGIRPTVRGVAMNPVDHPHGGGEGKTSGGRHPVSPTGVPAKGKKTRKNKRTQKFIIRSRSKQRRRA